MACRRTFSRTSHSNHIQQQANKWQLRVARCFRYCTASWTQNNPNSVLRCVFVLSCMPARWWRGLSDQIVFVYGWWINTVLSKFQNLWILSYSTPKHCKKTKFIGFFLNSIICMSASTPVTLRAAVFFKVLTLEKKESWLICSHMIGEKLYYILLHWNLIQRYLVVDCCCYGRRVVIPVSRSLGRQLDTLFN